MTWLTFLSRSRPAAHKQRPTGAHTKSKGHSAHTVRRELVSVALRETLLRHGIPTSWVVAETRVWVNGRGDALCDVRLQLRRWEPLLLQYATALQLSLLKRITIFDAAATTWLRDISWQFDLPPDTVASEMPAPETWRPQPVQAAPSAEPAAAPVLQDQLEELRRAMADGDIRATHGGRVVDFQATQPFLNSTGD